MAFLSPKVMWSHPDRTSLESWIPRAPFNEHDRLSFARDLDGLDEEESVDGRPLDDA
jgi:hypothetical protein